MGSLPTWSSVAADKARETYKAPTTGGFSGNLNLGLSTRKEVEPPRPFKAPGTELFDTQQDITFSGKQLNVKRFYEHPAYSKLGVSAFRDNDAYYNKNSSAIGDFVRSMKHFGPGFRDGFASNYAGFESLVGGKATDPSLLDYSKGRNAEEAASIAMSTRGGWKQSAVNIPFNFNYTFGIAASIALEDLALTAAAPATFGGTLTGLVFKTGRDIGRVATSLGRLGRSLDRVADARNAYNAIKGIGTGTARMIIPETATQFGKFYRTGNAVTGTGRIGEATLNMISTAKGFGSMYRDLRMVNLAIDESGVEAVGVRNGLMDRYVSEFSAKNNRLPNPTEYAEMKKLADDALTADYFANLPVIYLTNKLTFGNASLAPRFIRNYAAAVKTEGGRLLLNATKGKVTSQIVERTLNPVKYIKRAVTNRQLAKANLYATAKYFKANLGEGVQELYQTGAATTFEDYYYNLYNNPSMNGFKYYKQSAKQGIGSLVSQEGFEAFAGGLLGGGAINTISKGTRLGKEFIMSKASPEQYEKTKRTQQEQLKFINDFINKEGENVKDFLAPDIATLVELINENGAAYDFADAGNFKGVEDIRVTSLYKKIQQLESAGATQTFIDALQEMKSMEAEEKMEAFGVDSVEKADKLIDVIVDRSQNIKTNIEYVNKTYENPYNPNNFKQGTKERNEEILKQFAYEQAKKDLAFNLSQFKITAQRLGEIYNSAIKDQAVEGMLNRDFSVLFNTTLAESKKSGVQFETSLDNEIGFLATEKTNAQAELENIDSQLPTADETGKAELQRRKRELQEKINRIEDRSKSLVKYASAIEKVKKSRATLKEGEERPSEEQALKDMYDAFAEYMQIVGKENNTPVDALKLQETFGKLLDFIDVAEDNRLATNAITLLTDPNALQKLADAHFDGVSKRFELHSSLGKMIALGVVESKRTNEFIEALEEIGVVIPLDQMQALLLEGVTPTKYLSISEVDTDPNGFVIEGSPLWEQIQEIADQYEMGKAEAEVDAEEITRDPESEEALKAEGEAEAEAAETEATGKSSMAEQAARSQQASKEAPEKEQASKRRSRQSAKYQEVKLRKDLAGTKVLEKLDEDFITENARRKEAGERQQTFTQFVNGLSNIDNLVKQGQEQASKLREQVALEKTAERYQKRLERAKTIEDVDLIEMDVQTLPMISESLLKLDFQKRRNEIMAEEAKKQGVKNIPDTAPSVQSPTGENKTQAEQTVQGANLSDLVDENTRKSAEEGGNVDDDINNILC